MAESASERYARLLFPQKLGYPLFLPQLSDDIIPGWRKTGIRIGHVGVVRADGSFDPIFNIFPYPQDVDPNPKDVPTNFKALRFEDFRDPAPFISRRVRHEPGADISNDVIGKRRLDGNAGVNSNVFLPIGADAAIEVSTNSEELALLLLPDGSSSLELRPLEVFEDYAKKHAVDWYQFVNGVLKYRIKNGDLYLVTAVIRAKSWSVATKHKNSGDRQFTLKLQAAQVGAAGASCSWEWEGRSSSLDSGPKRPADEDPTWNNQTVFFSGFKVKLRSQRLKVWQPGYQALYIGDSEWSDLQSKDNDAPYSGTASGTAHTSGSTSSPPASGSGAVHDTLDLGSVDDNDWFNRGPNQYHPSNAINDHLLRCARNTSVMVAVTHDNQWAALLKEGEDQMPTDEELIRRIPDKFDIDDTIRSGGISLRERTPPRSEDPPKFMVRPQSHLSSALYSSLLLSGHHGYPLLNPQPLDEIPAKLREIGTQIGDVGVVTEDGSFEPFFNILHEAGDKIINWLGVPKYFERLVLSHGDVSKSPLYHERGSYISNTTLNVKRLDADVTDATFVPVKAGVVEVSPTMMNAGQIALLVLPDGASRWDLRSMTLFRDYAVRHAQNWYKFVNGQLGRSIGNSGLMLITGVTKSTSWAVAIRQNTSGNAPLTLRAVQVAGAEPLCVWECVDQSDWSFFSGPTRRLGEETWKDNQTPFLRGFKVTTRPTPLMEPMKIGVSDGVTEKNFVY